MGIFLNHFVSITLVCVMNENVSGANQFMLRTIPNERKKLNNRQIGLVTDFSRFLLYIDSYSNVDL